MPKRRIEILFTVKLGGKQELYYHAKHVEVSEKLVIKYGISWVARMVWVQPKTGTIMLPPRELRIEWYNGHLSTIRDVLNHYHTVAALAGE